MYIREIFKLKNIRGEQDLQEYKNLLNSMAALFYTNHRMTDVSQFFGVWRSAAAQKQEERMRQQRKVSGNKVGGGPPKIQIDTELANQEAFKNYHHLNQPGAPPVGAHMPPQFTVDDEPSEIPQGDDTRKNMMIHIEGDDNMDNILSEEIIDEDLQKDLKVRGFLDELLKVGPFAKQIMNYSYPPLLYQRGDGEDEEDEDDDDMQGDEEEDEDEAVRDILGGDENMGPGFQLPDFEDEDDYEGDGMEDEDDREIQELVKGAHHNHNQLLMHDGGGDFDYEHDPTGMQ